LAVTLLTWFHPDIRRLLAHPALRHALTLTPRARNRMRTQAREFAATRYDHPTAVQAFLARSAPWLDP